MKPRLIHGSVAARSLLACGLLASISYVHAQTNGTWSANAAGNWSDTTKWSGGNVASGATAIADFSTLDITGDHIITVDAPFTIGTLKSQDLTTLSNSWTFAGTGPLTLANGVSQPVLDILNRTPSISVPLAGTNGFSKTGVGLVTLSGNNSGLSGAMTLVDVGGSNNAGVVLASDTAIGGITSISIGGSATSGQYLSLSGGVTLGSGVSITLNSPGGNSAPPGGIRSEGANTVVNTIQGPINVTLNASRISNNSARRLDITGAITAGANEVVFRNAVNEGIHLTNTSNSWTGQTTHSGGTLWVDPGCQPASSRILVSASDAGTYQTNGTFSRSLGTGAGQVRIGSGTSSGRAMGFGARGGDLTLNFGGAGAEVFFNNFTANANGTDTTINTNTFVLNGAEADSKITLANPLNLNGAARSIQVSANVAEITGGLTGGAFSYTKTSSGTLLLSVANSWTGDLVISNANDSVNGGIVRATHAEAFGPPATTKNINAMGLNRGISIVELVGGISIDANKSLRMWGKNMAMSGNTGSGISQSLRSVSGNNAWNGNVVIANSGGTYGIECQAGTLTLGSSPATTNVMRNEVASSTRTMALYGAGDYVINHKIADNGAANIVITKAGSGGVSIPRSDNDFDTVPNLFTGLTSIVSLTNSTSPSSLGTASSFNLGATLRYTGAGNTSDRALSLMPTGGTLDSSGTGPLVLTSTSMTHNAGITSTIAAPFALGATSLVLNDLAGIAVGQTITGTGIPAGATVTALNVDTRTATLSAVTTAASTVGVTTTIGNAANIDRTLVLTGSNTGDNKLAAPLSNPNPGKLAVNKTGAGKWILNGTAQTYTGTTTVNNGTLGFDGAFPAGSALTVAPAATLSLANLTLRADPSALALSIAGNLAIDGPVNIILPDAAPIGGFNVLQYASLTGVGNLTSNYRNASFTNGGTSATMTVAAGTPLIWTGALSNDWDLNQTENWKDVGNVSQKFMWADAVRFDSAGASFPGVVLVGELRPASVLVDVDSATANYSFSGGGTLTGPFPLTKNGSSTLTINGTHTFNGGITVNGGVLIPGGNQSLGANGQQITIASGAALNTNGVMNANRDYAATISGTGTDGSGAIINTAGDNTSGFGSLTLAANATIGGSGRWDVRPITAGTALVNLGGFTLTKTGSNIIGLIDGAMTSDGSIDINQGILAITRMNVSGAGSINANSGGTLRFENYTSGTFSKAVNVNDGTVVLTGSNMTVDGPITLTGTATFNIGYTPRVFTATQPVGGAGALSVVPPGTGTNPGVLVLQNDNTYAGATSVDTCTLRIGNRTATGSINALPVTLANNGNLQISRSDTYTFPNTIQGSGGVMIGANAAVTAPEYDSVVTLTGTNTFTGGVTVYSGALKIQNASALGTGAKMVTVGTTNGTNGRPQLHLDGSGGNITLPSDVSFQTSNNDVNHPTLNNLAGNNVINGILNLTAGGGNTIVSIAGGSLALNGNVQSNILAGDAERRLVLTGNAGTGTINGLVSNGTKTFHIDKTGSNTWTLTGNNTYTGTTVINGGTLLINGNQGTASGTVSVASGATLGGTGTIGGTVSAAAGSTVAPGTSIGTLTTVSPVSIAGNLAIEMNATTSDRLTVGGSLDVSAAALNVSVSGTPSQPAYIIASYGVLTGNFASTSGIPAGYAINYNYNSLNQIALEFTGGDYTTWAATFPGFVDTAAGSDPDGDGLTNQQEYAFGLDPTKGNSVSPITQMLSKTGGTFKYTRRLPSLTGLAYTYESSTTLGGWGAFTPVSETSNSGSPVEEITVTLPGALLTNPKLFVRVKAN